MTFNILIVEDQYSDARQVLEALHDYSDINHLDVNLTEVVNGADAIDYIYCRGHYASRLHINPGLIILDLQLPKIDGFELLEKIKQTPTTKGIPAVILTGLKSQRTYDACLELNADDLVIKPVDYNEFKQAVFEIGKNWIMPRIH